MLELGGERDHYVSKTVEICGPRPAKKGMSKLRVKFTTEIFKYFRNASE